ncbi:hypothetical protein [Mycobacteroides abscessus]|uniref:hypothetical protein n=1 Tax=Mycobacteroides abscessus TaxID=36809 RepID=UPI000D3E9CAB|nr:hypothetical protein [Mycobacteroides abscessus]PVA22676.1 hypothetical protein DDJ61_03240 [Mycobacteroides abscessus]
MSANFSALDKTIPADPFVAFAPRRGLRDFALHLLHLPHELAPESRASWAIPAWKLLAAQHRRLAALHRALDAADLAAVKAWAQTSVPDTSGWNREVVDLAEQAGELAQALEHADPGIRERYGFGDLPGCVWLAWGSALDDFEVAVEAARPADATEVLRGLAALVVNLSASAFTLRRDDEFGFAAELDALLARFGFSARDLPLLSAVARHESLVVPEPRAADHPMRLALATALGEGRD